MSLYKIDRYGQWECWLLVGNNVKNQNCMKSLPHKLAIIICMFVCVVLLNSYLLNIILPKKPQQN